MSAKHSKGRKGKEKPVPSMRVREQQKTKQKKFKQEQALPALGGSRPSSQLLRTVPSMLARENKQKSSLKNHLDDEQAVGLGLAMARTASRMPAAKLNKLKQTLTPGLKRAAGLIQGTFKQHERDPHTIHVTVKSDCGQLPPMTIGMKINDKFKELKTAIQQHMLIQPVNQMLLFNGHKLSSILWQKRFEACNELFTQTHCRTATAAETDAFKRAETGIGECTLKQLGIRSGQEITFEMTSFAPFHVEKNKGRWAYTPIDDASLRAISLSQLQDLVKFILDRCHSNGSMNSWAVLNLLKSSSLEAVRALQVLQQNDPAAARLSCEKLDIYAVTHYIITPATEDPVSTFARPKGCSFVELVAKKQQKPDWFASHYWGDSLIQLMACLKHHCKTRLMNEASTHFWISAFAHNMHEWCAETIRDPRMQDPRNCGYYKAMKLSQGMLMLLGSDAHPLRRMWCQFEASSFIEISKSCQDQQMNCIPRPQPMRLDVAAIDSHGAPQLITSGLTDEEVAMAARGEDAYKKKTSREAAFPISILWRSLLPQQGYSQAIDIMSCGVTEEIDNQRIMNAIAGVPSDLLDSTPVGFSEKYAQVNAALMRLWGAVSLPAALRAADLPKESPLWSALATTTSADVLDPEASTSLRLEVSATGFNDQNLAALGRIVLPAQAHLRSLVLNFGECKQIHDVSIIASAIADLTELEHLEVDFSGCAHFTGISGFWLSLKSLINLQYLQLNCTGCVQITRGDLLALGQSLSNLQHLKCLYTNFKECSKIENLSLFDATFESISHLSALWIDLSVCPHLVDTSGLSKLCLQAELRRLVLDLHSCDRLVQLTDVCQSLASLRKLDELSIRLGYCAQFNDANSLFKCVSTLKMLTQLQLDMSDCPLIEEITAGSLQTLTQLKDLNLDFTNCQKLPSIEPFTRELSSLTLLRTLKLHLTNCKKVSNIAPLGDGLGTQLKMKHLEMHFQNCCEIRDLSPLGSLETLGQLKHLVLDFYNCKYLQDCVALSRSIQSLDKLKHLELNFNNCKTMTGIDDLLFSLAKLTKLEYLELRLTACENVSDLAALGFSLCALTGLKVLKLDLNSIKHLSNISPLAQGLQQCVLLEELEISMNRCGELVDVSPLKALSALTKLRHLKIDLGLSKHLKLTNFGECGLATALCRLPSLKSIEISLNQIEGLSVLGAFTFVCMAAALMGLAPLTISIAEVQCTLICSLSV